MKKGFFGWVLFIALAVLLFMHLNKNKSQYASIPLSDFVSRLEADKVRWIEVQKDELFGAFYGAETVGSDKVGQFRVVLPEGSTTGWTFMQWLLDNNHNASIGASREPDLLINILVPLLPWLLIFVFIWFFVFRHLRKSLAQQQEKAKEPLRVFVVNQPGEPPFAQPAPPPT